jgi:hypothetical protein
VFRVGSSSMAGRDTLIEHGGIVDWLGVFGRASLPKGAIPWANLSGLQTRAQAEVGCLRDQPVLFVTFIEGPEDHHLRR